MQEILWKKGVVGIIAPIKPHLQVFEIFWIMLSLCKSQPTSITSQWHMIRNQFTENRRNLSSTRMTPPYVWNVMDIFHETYSALMLNTPILGPHFATTIWRKANFKILVDGGGNVLYDLLFNNSGEKCTKDLPDVLCGDFDSIRADVLEFFQKKDVKIICTPDQDKPDFFKGLEILSENAKDQNVIVYCDNIGRLDHIMQNLNTLFKCSSHETLNKFNIFLLNNKSLTWLLKPGTHSIHVPRYLWTSKSHCGLIPVGQPCYHVTTKGLKWNLNNGELQFGKMVSSSNAYDITSDEAEVRVSTDNNLIWTMSIDEKIISSLPS